MYSKKLANGTGTAQTEPTMNGTTGTGQRLRTARTGTSMNQCVLASYYVLASYQPGTTIQKSYDKTCILRQNLHPTTRLATYNKTCILRQNLHPTTRLAHNHNKSTMLQQDLHLTTTRVASYDKTCTQPQ